MTELELQQQRARNWRTAGNPVRTLEDARNFVENAGFCLMYPERSLPMVATFIGAYAGSSEHLPDAVHAFADPRTRPATELMVRLLRERAAFEINLAGGCDLIVSPPLFPFFCALVGDHNPKAAPKVRAQGAVISPLAVMVFEAIQRDGPLSKHQLREKVGREPSSAGLDRALSELWAILKITRVDYREREGAFWDVLYRWAPDAVKEGVNISLPEAISALVSKYLEAAVAVGQEEIEQLFSRLTSRSKVREAVNALLAARELSWTSAGTKNLLHLTPAPPPQPGQNRPGPGTPEPRRALHEMNKTARGPQTARRIVIAIDGPAGSGKSTVAALLARKYGYTNIETGAMYRAMALKAMVQGVSLKDGAALGALASQSRIELLPRSEGSQVLLDGNDVTERIRRQDVTDAASHVSVHPPVREWMVRRQQEMGAGGGIIMEGRDIGTKVFPGAEVKIFLDAAPEVRGTRRFLQDPNAAAPQAAVLAEMRARDERDRNRSSSPLVPAPDAVLIDSTRLTLEQVVERAEKIIDAKLANSQNE